MAEEVGIFKNKGTSFRAIRRFKKFTCQIDGQTMTGQMLEWEVRREDGATFPVPDTLFKILFEPLDDYSRELCAKTYTITAAMSESIRVKDAYKLITDKFKKES